MKISVMVSPEHFYLSGIVVQHIKKNIQDSWSSMVVITQDPERLRAFHQWLGTECDQYISDDDACDQLGVPRGIDCWSKQFLIMNIDRLIDADTVLNIDSDVIFNRPIQFVESGRCKFFLESEHYEPYFLTIKDCLGLNKQLPDRLSFIADFMLFESGYLEQIRSRCDILDNWRSFYTAVEKNTPRKENAYPAFSEYETYATWLYYHHPERMVLLNSATFGQGFRYHKFVPTQQNLAVNNTIIPMRSTYDSDIDWNQVYPQGWAEFSNPVDQK